MSRSVHDTHGVLRRILRDDWSDREEKWERARAVIREVDRQCCIKRRVQEHRGGAVSRDPPPFDPDHAAIVAVAGEPSLHHPATDDDLRAVMRRMVPGSLDGLGPVYLE